MLLKNLNKLFPFYKLLRLLAVFAFILKTIIISYNHFSGYYTVTDFSVFIRRLLYSAFFTVIAGLLIAYPDLIIINFLNIFFQNYSQAAMKHISENHVHR